MMLKQQWNAKNNNNKNSLDPMFVTLLANALNKLQKQLL